MLKITFVCCDKQGFHRKEYPITVNVFKVEFLLNQRIDNMKSTKHKYDRPDYDYYENSIGDAYGDYDELEENHDTSTDGYYRESYEDEYRTELRSRDYENCALAEDEYIPSPSDDSPDGTRKYKYTKEYVTKLMDMYHNGTEDDKQYVQQQFCIMLTPLIKRMIRTSRGIDSENNDYIQHCYLYICKRLDRFDPNLSFAFEYFKYVIREAITSCYETSMGKSSHETNVDRKVRSIVRSYSSTGINPSPSRIAADSGLSVRQVEDSLSRICAENLVLSEDLSVFDRNDHTNMPLDAVLKNEMSETLVLALEYLPANEREAIQLSYNFNNMPEDYTNRKISEIMNISEAKVKELLISAKRHLKKDFSLDQLLGKSKRITIHDYDVYASDPVRSSFDPDAMEYRLIDTDDEEEIIEELPPKRTVFLVNQYHNISFTSY